jgi:hypothetical protein
MTRLRLQFVHSFHKGGRTYFYFRRKGKRTPLPGLPGSTAFMAAYAAALDVSEPQTEIGASRTIPGTVNAVIAAFYKSRKFTKNQTITQKTDRNILESFRVAHGHKRIATMERRHIEGISPPERKPGSPSPCCSIRHNAALMLCGWGRPISEAGGCISRSRRQVPRWTSRSPNRLPPLSPPRP